MTTPPLPLDDTLAQRVASYAKLFAASVSLDPALALREVGWLEPEAIPNLEVRTFWARLRAGESLIASAAAVGTGFHKALIGWVQYLPDFADVREYAHQLEQAAYQTSLAELTIGLAGALGEGDPEAVEQARRKLLDVKPRGKAESLPAHESLEGLLSALDNMGNRSIPIEVGGFDAATGGLERQTMTILAARPSMGKTALAWQMAQAVAQKGLRAMYFTLESSAVSLWARTACGLAGVRWRDVRSGRVSEEQKARVYEETIKLMGVYQDYLWVNEKPNTVASVWREMAYVRPDLIVIDHLRWLRDPGANELVRLGVMSARLKEAAKEFNCHALVLTQLSRGVESRDDKRPNLSDLRESGHLEENADNVFFLYRDDYYAPTQDPVKPTELIIGKFRDDVRNQVVRLDYHLERQQFTAPSTNWRTVKLNGALPWQDKERNG